MRRRPLVTVFPAILFAFVVGPVLAQESTETPTAPDAPVIEAASTDPVTPDAAPSDTSTDAATSDDDSVDDDDDASSTDGNASDAGPSDATREDSDSEPKAPVEDVPLVDEALSEATAVVDVVVLPAEDLDTEEAKARVRADAANKAVIDGQSIEKLAEKEAADKALAAILDKKRKVGFWYEKALTIGASGSGLYNQKFVGQADGFALQAGAILNGMFALGYSGNEWHNTLTIEESLLATPTDDLFSPRVAKSADNLQMLSSYNYRWSRFPWVGPYAQLRGQTQIFQSGLQPATDGLVVQRTFRDGRVQQEIINVGQAAFLTDFFEPLTVTESVGVFIEPPTVPPWLVYGFKVGAAGQHVIVRDGFVVADDAATAAIELQQLSLSNSFGSEAEANVSGQITELFLWSVLARVYYPILILEETELDLVERTHLDLQTTLSLRLTKWLSADWVTKVRRQPFVLNDWQIQSQVLLTTGFSIL